MSTYPVQIGSSNGGNAAVMRGLKSRRIRYAWGPHQWFSKRIAYTQMTLPAATTETVTLSTLFPGLTYPTNVMRGKAYVRVITPFAGGAISAMTVQVGDAGDPNGLLTATSVFAALNPTTTPAAAEYADRSETAYDPQVLFTATGANMSAVTAGEIEVAIGFRPLLSV